jgi:hypothetical protein
MSDKKTPVMPRPLEDHSTEAETASYTADQKPMLTDTKPEKDFSWYRGRVNKDVLRAIVRLKREQKL